MISCNVNIPPTLLNRLNQTWVDNRANELTDATSNDVLWSIQEYGFGSAGGNTPSGGSPIWQGRIYEKGHYRGYLTESHYIKKISPYNAQVVTSADFADSLIRGVSTNWYDSEGNPIVFGENRYHKRAVDGMIRDGKIPTIWRNIVGRG